MIGRARANGEGSIFPYRNCFAAYVWVSKPNGQRQRKYMRLIQAVVNCDCVGAPT